MPSPLTRCPLDVTKERSSAGACDPVAPSGDSARPFDAARRKPGGSADPEHPGLPVSRRAAAG